MMSPLTAARGALIAGGLGLLAGCHTAPAPPPRLAPLEQPAKLQPAAPRVNGTIPNEFSRQRAFVAEGSPARPAIAPQPRGANLAAEGKITLDFVDTDIREIARTILGKMLRVSYTIDPDVKGTASFQTGRPIARAALIPTLEMLLNQNGATLVKRHGVYRVMLLAAGAVSNPIAGNPPFAAGTQVVALRYASAPQLAKVLAPYVTGTSKITPDPAGNALIVSGDAASRAAIVALIRAFDVNLLSGQSYAIFPAGDSDPKKLADELQKVLQAGSNQPLSGIVRVLPMERVDGVLVISSQPSYIQAARRLIGIANNAEDETARSWHVYYVQNGQSADLQNLLQQAFTPGHVTPIAAAPGATAPGAQPISISGFSSSGTTGGTSGGLPSGLPGAASSTSGIGGLSSITGTTPGGIGAASPLSAAAGAARSAATEPLSATSEERGPANRIRIIADPRNNALLIYATPSEYHVIKGMLDKVDIIPLQVLISATIAQVTLNDKLQYGTEWYARIGAATAELTTSSTATFANPFPGFVIGKSQSFVLNALADITKVKVLSAPQVMVLDNQPASLQVGQDVPVLTGTATSTLTTGAPIVNSVDYHETGVIMIVTPRVNSSGLVTLDIAQEVSSVAPAAENTVQGSPTFDDQRFLTRVAVQNGETVGLAGLITDNASEQNSGVPWLKDVPVLGTLLSSQSNERQRSELLVLITPHVVYDQRDARALTEDLRQELINAALVPQELQTTQPSGSANPNGIQ